jgi:hypothetical protein
MLKYWFKILKTENCILKNCYEDMFELTRYLNSNINISSLTTFCDSHTLLKPYLHNISHILHPQFSLLFDLKTLDSNISS